MTMFPMIVAMVALGVVAKAQPAGGVSLRVTTETVPAGGVAQVKIELTEPKPIVRSGMFADFDESFFDGFLGFSAGGELTGVARVQNGRLRVELSGYPNAALLADYPLVTVAVRTKATLPVGAATPIALDLSNSFWIGETGQTFAEEAKTGGVTIGGTMFVSNVLAGAGTLARGETVRVTGAGFVNGTKVRAENLKLVSISPAELVLRADGGTQLSGERIRVELPNKERQTYYSYLRGVKVQPTADSALTGIMPVFSSKAHQSAMAGLSASGRVAGIGLQNPGRTGVRIQLDTVSAAGQLLHRAFVELGPREVLFRSYEEIFGTGVPAGAYALVVSVAEGAFQFVVAEVEPGSGNIRVPLVTSLQNGVY